MKKLLIILCFTTTVCLSQKKDKRAGAYSAYLDKVEVPKEMILGTIDSNASIYEDDLIKIDWHYAYSQMDFDFTNKSDQTLKIIWDNAAFISVNNESNRIFHKGIKFTDKENPQAPTSVYKSTSLSELIAPTTYAHYVSGQYGGWRSEPLLPDSGNGWSKKVEYKPELLGLTMRVILPIEIEGKVIEYAFSFKTVFLEYPKE